MSSIRLARTFIAVATEGSFAAAANRVALTQAAVGQQMRALESDLHRPLFERQGKSVVLNEAGRELLPAMRKLVGLYDQMQASAASPEPMSGTVHLGALVSAVRPLIQATLSLKARHPALALHVSAAKSMELAARVEAGELDAAIAVREPGQARPGLTWTPLYDEPMVVLAPRSAGEGGARALLQRLPFIRFDRSQHTGLLVQRMLRRLRVEPEEFLELNAIESIADLVRSGLGVAILPHLQGGRWTADARLRVVDIPKAEVRRVAVVQARDAVHAPVIAAVIRELRSRLQG
ncbi:MAG: LysR family transcriptional regulator [Ramlibacter sp.]|nr:LysR family transcriptional regulator [Ramlibacter sp.]